MDARIEAARNGETKQLQGPASVPDVHPVLDKTHTQGRSDVAAAEALDQLAAKESRTRQVIGEPVAGLGRENCQGRAGGTERANYGEERSAEDRNLQR
jgi:hypothetical protein